MLFPFSRSVAGGDGFLNAEFIVKTTRFIAELQRFLAMQLQLKVKHTVRPRLTDTHLIRSPHYYRQFALSLGNESPYSFSKFKPLITDTPSIQTLSMASSVSVETGIDCSRDHTVRVIVWVDFNLGLRKNKAEVVIQTSFISSHTAVLLPISWELHLATCFSLKKVLRPRILWWVADRWIRFLIVLSQYKRWLFE